MTAVNLTGLPMRSTIWLPEVRKYVKVGMVGAWVRAIVGLGITRVMLGSTGGSGRFLLAGRCMMVRAEGVKGRNRLSRTG